MHEARSGGIRSGDVWPGGAWRGSAKARHGLTHAVRHGQAWPAEAGQVQARQGAVRQRQGMETYEESMSREDNYRTSLERAVAETLQELGIPFRDQVPLRIGFVLDFVIETPNGKVIVEADGPTHATGEGRQRDWFRDRCLKDAGWTKIYHLSQSLILNKDKLIQELRQITSPE